MSIKITLSEISFHLFFAVVLILFFSSKSFAQQCDCTEMLYLNERKGPGKGVHKFAVNENFDLSSVVGGDASASATEIGTPWYKTPAGGDIFDPHGIALDLNGFAYVGETDDGDIRRFTCDGTLFPHPDDAPTDPTAFAILDGGFNFASLDGMIYLNRSGPQATNYGYDGIIVYDPCDAAAPLGYYCLDGVVSDNNDWGFWIDQNGIAYATGHNDGLNAPSKVWVFDIKASTLNAPNAANPVCISPVLEMSSGGYTDVNIGDSFLPNFGIVNQVGGVASDGNGNMWIVQQAGGTNNEGVNSRAGRVLKYTFNTTTNQWELSAKTAWDDAADADGWYEPLAIVYSKKLDALFTTSRDTDESCIYLFDSDLNPVGNVQPPTGSNEAKGLGIITECCPVNSSDSREYLVCDRAVGQKVYLNYLLNCNNEGGVCEGQWEEISATGIDFDNCDLSLTLTAENSCGQYRISKGPKTGNQQCDAFSYDVTICFGDFAATLVQSDCNDNGTPGDTSDDYFTVTANTTTSNTNSGATIEVVLNADDRGLGGTILATGAVGTPIIVGDGTNGAVGTFVADGSTTYDLTVRVLGRRVGCNEMFTTTASDCSAPPTGDCSCKEYLYVNDTDLDQVHKFAINATSGAVTEIDSDPTTSAIDPWLAGISRPHGLASDINGYLYIGELFGDVWRIDCNGTPVSQNFFDTVGKNFAEFENLILTNSEDGLISAWDPCNSSTAVGAIQLVDENGVNAYNNWGFYKDINDKYYASGGTETNDLNAVWTFDLELADFTSGSTFSPILENTDFPSEAKLYGITADATGNFYIYYTLESPNFDNVLEKYDSNGNLINSVVGNWGQVGWDRAQGIVYSETANLVYISGGAVSNADCVGYFDPITLNYTGVVGHVSGQDPKGLGINKECCPNISPLVFNETVCGAGNGEKVFLNQVFNCGNGNVCEGTWSVETANANHIFNDCDLSITVNGSGCGTYVLQKTTAKTGAQQCDPFRIEVNICTEIPEVTISANQGTCASSTPNNDASIVISNGVNVDEANISIGSTYTGAVYGDASNIDLSGGSGMLTGLMHNTQYTIRIFNGSDDCYTDENITTPSIICTTPTGNCNCTEYLYVNDTDLDIVHKFAVNPNDGTLTEVDGDDLTVGVQPWLTGINDPHGLAADLNGFIYIGELGNSIWKMDCDGTVIDNAAFAGGASGRNFAKLDNLILTNSPGGRITAWDPCDGSEVGRIELDNNDGGDASWGFYYDGVGNYYASAKYFGNVEHSIWRFSLTRQDFIDETVFQPILNDADFPNTDKIWGITANPAGDYFILTYNNAGDNELIKYDANDNFVTSVTSPNGTSPWDRGQGIYYSNDADVIYISGGDPTNADCVGYFDPVTLAYTTLIPHVTGQDGKGLAIAKECCPINTPLTINETVCAGAGVQTVYLQDLIDCGEGTICGGTWAETTNNTGGLLVYNNCDKSVTVSGAGCATYTLSGTDASSTCGLFEITVEVCAAAPSAQYMTNVGTCNTNTPNNDASITLSNVVGADEANISIGATYLGNAYGDASNQNISSGSGSLSGLMHNTQYTVRIWNGADNCFVDETITTPTINCTIACNLTDAGKTLETCNDNGTNTDPSDDFITFNLNPVGAGIGSTYSVSVDNSGVVTQLGGSSASGVSYGSATTFRLQNGSANNTNYTVTITDDATPTCQQMITVQQNNCAVALYSLGNRVFYDDDNNGINEATENGVAGITLQLLNADGSVYDSDPSTSAIDALIVTTGSNGYYRFDGLPADSYIVEIQASAFTSGGTLETFTSSNGTGEEANPNIDGDLNDNGIDPATSGSAIRSGVITLGGTEPMGEQEPVTYEAGSFTGTPSADTESNLTVDFGFYRQRDRPDCCDDARPPCAEEPCHFISNDIYFGSGVTNDNNDLSSGSADNDVDDGILLNEKVQIIPGSAIRLPLVFYNNTGQNAYIRGWVDWNDDGDFDDAGEQVADLTYLSAIYTGSFTEYVNINIPADAIQDNNLATRWRISTDNTNTSSPCGNGNCANDGEIEDYLLRVSCPTSLCPTATIILTRN